MRKAPVDVAAQLKALEGMSGSELRAKWREVFGRAHPGWVQRGFLIHALAYRAQEEAFGGLSPALRRQLGRLGEEVQVKGRITASTAPQIKPGTRLVREWGGGTHVVTVAADGLEYRGKRYGSLSEVARAITGTRWSGPAFFGLKSPTPAKAPRRAPDGG